MLSLKELKKEERSWVLINSVGNLYYTPYKANYLLNVVNELSKLSGLSEIKYQNELYMLAICIAKAKKINKIGVWFPRRWETYTKFNKISKSKLKLNKDRMCELIDTLEEGGFLTVYLGYRDIKEDTNISSRVIFGEILLGLINDTILKSTKDVRSETPEIEVCYKEKGKRLKYEKLTRFKMVKLRVDVVKRYNKFIDGFVITIDGKEHKLFYKRVYMDDLFGCGRWYEVGCFQTAKKELRKTIKINGNSVTEVDLTALHTNIIGTLQGVDLRGKDPYSMYDSSLSEILRGKKNLRSFCKLALMCIINCRSKTNAQGALYNIVKGGDEDFLVGLGITEDDCVKTIDKLLSYNKELKFFGKGSYDYKVLQNIDSDICEKVLVHSMNRGFVALGYHDSFIVENSNKEALIHIMRKSWVETFGNKDNFHYKIEF